VGIFVTLFGLLAIAYVSLGLWLTSQADWRILPALDEHGDANTESQDLEMASTALTFIWHLLAVTAVAFYYVVVPCDAEVCFSLSKYWIALVWVIGAIAQLVYAIFVTVAVYDCHHYLVCRLSNTAFEWFVGLAWVLFFFYVAGVLIFTAVQRYETGPYRPLQSRDPARSR